MIYTCNKIIMGGCQCEACLSHHKTIWLVFGHFPLSLDHQEKCEVHFLFITQRTRENLCRPTKWGGGASNSKCCKGRKIKGQGKGMEASGGNSLTGGRGPELSVLCELGLRSCNLSRRGTSLWKGSLFISWHFCP